MADSLVVHGLAALLGGAPALALALWGWWLERRRDRETIAQLREEVVRLMMALELAVGTTAGSTGGKGGRNA
jgi:hypothetical protein